MMQLTHVTHDTTSQSHHEHTLKAARLNQFCYFFNSRSSSFEAGLAFYKTITLKTAEKSLRSDAMSEELNTEKLC